MLLGIHLTDVGNYFVAFNGGRPVGTPVEVLGGFLSAEGKAHGRPVGVALDKQGALLVWDIEKLGLDLQYNYC